MTEQSTKVDVDRAAGQQVIEEHLTPLRNAYRLDKSVDDEDKLRLNQVLYQAIYIEDTNGIAIASVDLHDPYDALIAGQAALDIVGANTADTALATYQRVHATSHADKQGGPVQMDRPSSGS